VIASCCKLCLATACQLIGTLFDNLCTLYRSSGWHTVYFTFASAIVLLASSKLEDKIPHFRSDEIEAAWNKVHTILEHYENQIQSASRAAAILKTMRTRAVGVPSMQARPQISPLDAEGLKATPASNVQTVDNPAYTQFNLEDIDFYAADNISSAWFGQQLINLDWLDVNPGLSQ